MRWDFRPPSTEAMMEQADDLESSFFARTTVQPLYDIIKKASRKTYPASDNIFIALMCCCRKIGREHLMANSSRPGYDDVNERFWNTDCLRVSYHKTDPDPAFNLTTALFEQNETGYIVRKTFRESASWLNIALSFWRWWAFLAVLFHACSLAAADVVAAGGINITGKRE
jgi:hypothetical protein